MSTPFTQFTSPAEQAPKDYNKLGLENQLPTFETDWNNDITGWTEAAIIAPADNSPRSSNTGRPFSASIPGHRSTPASPPG